MTKWSIAHKFQPVVPLLDWAYHANLWDMTYLHSSLCIKRCHGHYVQQRDSLFYRSTLFLIFVDGSADDTEAKNLTAARKPNTVSCIVIL